MAQHSISSVVVSHGELGEARTMAMLSTSDVALAAHNPEILIANAHKVVVAVHNNHREAHNPCMSCSPTESVCQIAQRLATTRVHRIVVVDPQTRKLMSVVSLLDILKCLYGVKQQQQFDEFCDALEEAPKPVPVNP
eukprot:TRINITY_DN11677_c0_g1_i2.p3 TRINITY_DN11677_c0_g1~~TRINITY_DN11677_c0_g1_i2.p3  ORF type:complete len:137 (+),score=35.72 TRINITY_DN11677_c0_g1_i2:815-1225(+)